jgi:response regulator NasT
MKRVLVIDDHLASRRSLVEGLTASGFEVVAEGANAKTAIELAATAGPDAILMAVGLPDLDGIHAARKIMQANPHPIVLLTSHYDPETVERAKDAGVMGYLIKPLRASELAPAIEMAIAHYQEFIALRKKNADLKKTLEARKLIERAKGILMQSQGLSETEAFALLKRKSMDLRKPMEEIAHAVILSEEVTKRKSS